MTGRDPSPEWSHVGREGEARMVDVSGKAATLRRARAVGFVRMAAATRREIEGGTGPKGSVIGAARIAGIQAAKRTSSLIPLCHPLPIEKVALDFSWEEEGGGARLRIDSEVLVTAKTGVEMEALTAVAVAALTVYDMAKSADPEMVIEGIRLIEKTGGKSDFVSRVT